MPPPKKILEMTPPIEGSSIGNSDSSHNQQYEHTPTYTQYALSVRHTNDIVYIDAFLVSESSIARTTLHTGRQLYSVVYCTQSNTQSVSRFGE